MQRIRGPFILKTILKIILTYLETFFTLTLYH